MRVHPGALRAPLPTTLEDAIAEIVYWRRAEVHAHLRVAELRRRVPTLTGPTPVPSTLEEAIRMLLEARSVTIRARETWAKLIERREMARRSRRPTAATQ